MHKITFWNLFRGPSLAPDLTVCNIRIKWKVGLEQNDEVEWKEKVEFVKEETYVSEQCMCGYIVPYHRLTERASDNSDGSQ